MDMEKALGGCLAEAVWLDPVFLEAGQSGTNAVEPLNLPSEYLYQLCNICISAFVHKSSLSVT